MEELGLSARAHDKVLRVARTMADLDDVDHIEPHHIAEAVGYRSLDRGVWSHYGHGLFMLDRMFQGLMSKTKMIDGLS